MDTRTSITMTQFIFKCGVLSPTFRINVWWHFWRTYCFHLSFLHEDEEISLLKAPTRVHIITWKLPPSANLRFLSAVVTNISLPLGDLTISVSVLYNYLENSSKIPWEDLRYLFGEIMYGGHITDDWDRRLCRTFLQEWLQVISDPQFIYFFQRGPKFVVIGIKTKIELHAVI